MAETMRAWARPLRALVNSPRTLVGLLLAVWVCCSFAYALLERKGPIESLWWGIVTGSTVGYGDFYPSTTAGRGIGAILIVSMLVLLPIAIGHVIAGLVHDKEQLAVAEVLEDIHARLDRLEHLHLRSLEEQHGAEWVSARLAEHQALDDQEVDVAESMLALFRNKHDGGTP